MDKSKNQCIYKGDEMIFLILSLGLLILANLYISYISLKKKGTPTPKTDEKTEQISQQIITLKEELSQQTEILNQRISINTQQINKSLEILNETLTHLKKQIFECNAKDNSNDFDKFEKSIQIQLSQLKEGFKTDTGKNSPLFENQVFNHIKSLNSELVQLKNQFIFSISDINKSLNHLSQSIPDLSKEKSKNFHHLDEIKGLIRKLPAEILQFKKDLPLQEKPQLEIIKPEKPVQSPNSVDDMLPFVIKANQNILFKNEVSCIQPAIDKLKNIDKIKAFITQHNSNEDFRIFEKNLNQYYDDIVRISGKIVPGKIDESEMSVELSGLFLDSINRLIDKLNVSIYRGLKNKPEHKELYLHLLKINNNYLESLGIYTYQNIPAKMNKLNNELLEYIEIFPKRTNIESNHEKIESFDKLPYLFNHLNEDNQIDSLIIKGLFNIYKFKKDE